MEIWGGIECTINRVGNQYYNQLDCQGHYQRKEDLSLLANLGIQKLRYPVLWEKHQSEQDKDPDWGFIAGNLNYFREKGITVIAGLVHHGSGPSYADLLDDSFAFGLAAYAAAVAAKFPWIDYYTPVNEPLTTARFCGLYGLWYPHQKNDQAFLRILVNECKATILSMQAIRKINPQAKLVHTEDLGKTHSTPLLQYQADFENERRWLGLDLLCGNVNACHPLWNYMTANGITAEDLQFFGDNAMPPDVLGFNHYITSERYLDENIRNYPEHARGGNGKHKYADVEAVRCANVGIHGPKRLLREAWEIFNLPLAITEVHLYCWREEQMRWLMELWNAAGELEQEGVDIGGLTVWSLFGAYGWDGLLTKPKGNYESGVFDLRSGFPRATEMARLVQCLALKKQYQHPLIEGRGWWKRPDRILYPHSIETEFSPDHCAPVLIIGVRGTLGKAFARACAERNISYKAVSRQELDVVSPLQIEETIQRYQPWAIINAAGFVRVDAAEMEQQDCFLSNTAGPANLAAACKMHGIRFLTFSSDLVFDGEKKSAYIESDKINPLNVYGASKAKAEELVLAQEPEALVIRTSAFFSPWDNYNFVSGIIASLNNRRQVKVASDVVISPTYVPDLVHVSLDLLIDKERGIWHLSNQGTLSWSDFAVEVAMRSNLSPSFLTPLPVADLGYPARRPGFSALTSMHGLILPTLDNALGRFFAAIDLDSFAS